MLTGFGAPGYFGWDWEVQDHPLETGRWHNLTIHHLAYFEHMMADMKSSGTMADATVLVAVRALEQLVGNVD